MTDFETALERLLVTKIAGCTGLVSARRLSGGASQETYAVELTTAAGTAKLALRRAPGGAPEVPGYGRAGLATEARLIELARQAGVPEPEILFSLGDNDDLGVGFIMSWVEGETLGFRITRRDEFAAVRPRLAYQCGEILARIHAIDIAANGLETILDTLPPAAFIEQQRTLYEAFATPQPMIDYTARWLLENLPPAGPLTLVHNDFRNGNLIIDAEAGVVAVLDWELAHIGDPMRDLGWICTNSWRFGVPEFEVGGFGDLDDLIAGYESVSDTTVDRAVVRYWEVFGSFWWAIGCLTMAEHYRSGPDRSVERPAIGRRSSECQIDCVNLIMPGPVTLPEARPDADENMPVTAELIESVRDFLRVNVAAETAGRSHFLARVAANSLDIVARERTLGPPQAAAELDRLRRLLGHSGSVDALRWELVQRLRDGHLALDDAALVQHLRETVVARVAIDQPNYSGFATAMGAGRETPGPR
jgi:aminoglycoside phosphotransferase (APT) family kinase protein